MLMMFITIFVSFDGDDDVYYYMRWRLKLEGETENMGVCTKERKGINSRSTHGHCQPLPALIHWEVKVGGRSMKDVGGAVLAGAERRWVYYDLAHRKTVEDR